ncbi:hypothetical protein DZC73_28580 [Albitalea terrae]|uniref:Uncharacterized protein n=1 Tax=Piscinibacter terrae TaxID=2496871 RepID=A0A3N7HHB7_9BURK|nr:hypothetical protein DZC73_28580 [Albitalea terrae]
MSNIPSTEGLDTAEPSKRDGSTPSGCRRDFSEHAVRWCKGAFDDVSPRRATDDHMLGEGSDNALRAYAVVAKLGERREHTKVEVFRNWEARTHEPVGMCSHNEATVDGMSFNRSRAERLSASHELFHQRFCAHQAARKEERGVCTGPLKRRLKNLDIHLRYPCD